jgi:hypothetical protein
VVLDGVFTETDGDVRFHEATHFSADDAAALTPLLPADPSPPELIG